jgi:uncharacterized protein (TIRG00374 family)
VTPSRRRQTALLALRFGLTGAFLGVAFLLIDFEDRITIQLASGEVLEAVAVREDMRGYGVILKGGEERALLFGQVLKREDRPGLASVVRRVRFWPAVLVIPALGLLYLFQALRWRLLLKANDFDVPTGRAFRITWAGAFFNQILPGSVGGDVAKALIVAQGEERKAAVFGTVILDRLVGLATVVIIATLAILPVLGRDELRPVVWLIVVLLAGGAVGMTVYFNPALRRRLKARRLPFREVLEEVDDVLKTMHHAPRTILEAVGLSAAGQAATILGIYALAVSLGAGDVPVGDFFLIEPIIFLVTAVPVSVGGWGVEQVAYAHLFGMAGMAATTAVALSVVYKLSVLALSLPGGVLFAAGATRRGAAPVAAEVEERAS